MLIHTQLGFFPSCNTFIPSSTPQVDSFGPEVKCDDLISYSSSYAHGLGCTVCNYAPQTLRYLRDHIRKVHLAKLYKWVQIINVIENEFNAIFFWVNSINWQHAAGKIFAMEKATS